MPQLLSATLSLMAWLVVFPHAAWCQSPAAQTAGADVVVFKPRLAGAAAEQIATTIESVVDGKIRIRTGQSSVDHPLVLIQEVRKSPPVEWSKAVDPIEKGDFAGALPLVKSVVDRFKGLPTPWAMDATATLGNIYISLNKLGEAAVVFDDLERLYSGTGFRVARVGKAYIALERGKFAEAGDVALPVVSDAAQKKSVSAADGRLYGLAYYILGRVAENEGGSNPAKLPEAMEHYCRTVAVYYQDRAVVRMAQNRIDELRKKGITVP